jgi:hypothetical protein
MNLRRQEPDACNRPSRFPDAPPMIAALPVDGRSFPVPWFLAWNGRGEPDFQFVHPERAVQAIRQQRCWICGQRLGRMKAFVIGPMCAVNRISSEPPSHPMCAEFAATACPFLSRPLAKRGKVTAAQKAESATPGIMLDRNPGVTLVWWCLSFTGFQPRPDQGLLFQIGPPRATRWFREGRAATRDEVLESLETGLPALRALAEAEGPEALSELAASVAQAMPLIPKADTSLTTEGNTTTCQLKHSRGHLHRGGRP